MNKIQYILLFIWFISCSTPSSKLQQALEASGSNRQELEQVLVHYSQKTNDSLKLRAAEFLIANMPGHYSITGEEVERYVKQIDSMYPDLAHYFYPALYLQPYYGKHFKKKLERKYDIETLTADFLIKHIDFKFALRNSVPWGKEIPFDLFCETILPYRCDVEPLKDISQDALNEYIKRLKISLNKIKDAKINVLQLQSLLGQIVFPEQKNKIKQLPPPIKRYFLDCIQLAFLHYNQNIWLCLPSSIDMTPHWGSKNNRHYWVCIHSIDNKSYRMEELPQEMIAKVYRKTYSQNRYMDGVFNTRFLKDVTAEYANCEDVTIVPNQAITTESIYLCVYNEQKWCPVAWNRLQKSKAIFPNVARNILFMPVIYKKYTPVPIAKPFYIDMGGKMQEITCDTNQQQRLHLTRKAPIYHHHTYYSNILSGIIIEASHTPDFKHPVHIVSITTPPENHFYRFKPTSKQAFKYWRINRNRYGSLSEIRFYDENHIPLQGNLIYASQNKAESVRRLFDSDFLNQGHFNQWVGLEFPEPTTISKIEIIPPTDSDYIYPGEVYELYYHDGETWISHGIEEAKDFFVDFDHVPSNALYLLRHLTGKSDSRPFTFTNGRIRFW